MAESKDRPKSLIRRFGRWLLEARAVEPKCRVAKEGQPEQHSWWQVMCLTGVDYFSAGDEHEYDLKEREQRKDNHILADVPILFLEVNVEDPSEFEDVLEVRGVEIGEHRVLRAQS